MATEISNSLKSAAEKIASYVNNVATLTVETRVVDISGDVADFASAHPAACTVIRLDGDCSAVLPLQKNEAGKLEVDSALFELHERNVNAAMEYRTKMMNALLQAIKGG